MEYEQIKKLMDDMGESKLTSVDIEFPDGIKISMKKNDTLANNQNMLQMPVAQVNVNSSVDNEIIPQKEAENSKVVKSPMVGTFYSSPSASEKPFVEVGSKVKKGDILCIVEAMKLMNEIESEFDGEIAEIYVNNEEMVDYGKPLFKII